MTNISLSENNASLCYKDVCFNAKGKTARAVTVGIATIIVVTSIVSLLKTSR